MAGRRGDKERRRRERTAAEQAAAEAAHRRTTRIGWGIAIGGVVALVAAVVLAGGGSSDPVSRPQARVTAAELAGLPKGVAENLREANAVIDTPIDEKLDTLKGTPVVVNQWASWCTACRAEFPLFQTLAKRYRGEVAFVGLDSQDDRGAAEEFLQQFPVDYPSIFDSDASQALSIGGGQGWPTTMFFDASGESTFVRPGGYATLEQLDADIRRYALG